MIAAKGTGLGWAEALGRELAGATDEHTALRQAAKKIHKRSATHDYQCGLNGSRNGGSNTVRKLDRLLGKATDV